MNIQQLEHMRDYSRTKKPRKLIEGFTFPKPLKRGWMLEYLMPLEDYSWGRWDYWARTTLAGKLLEEPIPQIEWSSDHREGSPARKMLERTLSETTSYGDWRGWGSWSCFDYVLDWMLFGLGDPSQKEEPKRTGNVGEGASERLYQVFDLAPMLAFPYDYFGDILAENRFGKGHGFFPTPMDVCALMTQCTFEPGEDARDKTVCDPALGTGRMLLAASNHSLRLYGIDINATVIKACKVNGYLYAPWLVKPMAFLERRNVEEQQPQLELKIA